ncbi:unnamed protein product [Cladocopium goreaui]|uniref:Uncharacterized protein n=1 Tax=Cladocopium goreaui TaxID=2562237 RepID=A0A9P1DMC3_9DINO|nr:unnamed protein product [Cladocopium goreaui]
MRSQQVSGLKKLVKMTGQLLLLELATDTSCQKPASHLFRDRGYQSCCQSFNLALVCGPLASGCSERLLRCLRSQRIQSTKCTIPTGVHFIHFILHGIAGIALLPKNQLGWQGRCSANAAR